MLRQYFICNDLDELEDAQNELMQAGLKNHQVHVLSDDKCGITEHHLRGINDFSKTDIIRSTLNGTIIGLFLSTASLFIPYIFGLTTSIGWPPFIFIAAAALFFSTWEGGLWGIQEINNCFNRFEHQIHSGKHLMIIDGSNKQTYCINAMAEHHPSFTHTAT